MSISINSTLLRTFILADLFNGDKQADIVGPIAGIHLAPNLSPYRPHSIFVTQKYGKNANRGGAYI